PTYRDYGALTHSAEIDAAALSPDGQVIATGSRDGTVILWDRNGRILQLLSGHPWGVNDLAFSPDGKLLATAGSDGHLLVWDLDGHLRFRLKEDLEYFSSVAFSPNGRWLLCGISDGKVLLWDYRKDLRKQFEGGCRTIFDVAFDPDGESFVTSAVEGCVIRWDLKGKRLQDFVGHGNFVHEVQFSKDGRYLLSGSSSDSLVLLWDHKGTLLRRFPMHNRGLHTSLDFAPDGNSIVFVDNNSEVVHCDLEGNVLQRFVGHTDNIESVSFSADGRHLLTAGEDHIALLWDLDGRVLQQFSTQVALTDIAGSPEAFAALLQGWDPQQPLWNFVQEHYPILLAEGNENYRFFFNRAADSLLLFELRDSAIHLLDPFGGLQQAFVFNQKSLSSIAFSPEAQHLYTGFRDGTASLWNLQGVELQHYPSAGAPIVRAEFSPDGQQLLVGMSGGKVLLQELSGKVLQRIDSLYGDVVALAFSPDGKYCFAGASDRHYFSFGSEEEHIRGRLWATDGSKQLTLRGHRSGINSAIFTADSQSLLTASNDRTVRLWDLNGNQQKTYLADQEAFEFVAFNRDRSSILTANSKNGKVHIWPFAKRRIRRDLAYGSSTSIRFAPDGDRVAVGRQSGKVDVVEIAEIPIAQEKEEGFLTQPVVEIKEVRIEYAVLVKWDSIRQEWVQEGPPVKTKVFDSHRLAVSAIAFSADGQELLSGSEDSTVVLWDAQLQPLMQLDELSESVTAVALSTDKQWILVGLSDTTAQLWDRNGRLHRQFEGFSSTITGLTFFSDDAHALISSYSNCLLWNAATDQTTRFEALTDHSTILEFAPNGRYLLVANTTAYPNSIWDLKTQEQIPLQGEREPINTAIFSPNSQYLLTAKRGETATLWDMTGRPITYFRGHHEYVSDLAFAPDNNFLLTSDGRGTIYIWDLNGALLYQTEYDWHDRVSLSPDGSEIRILHVDTLYQEYTPWAFIQKHVARFSLAELQTLGLQFTQEDLDQMYERANQW
ncbi:MAG: hypothetical protein KDC44_20980, partial [Phaeodactylibacter sp.]|nr:hypothetical protein [Phaeodactylibacter sp.]